VATIDDVGVDSMEEGAVVREAARSRGRECKARLPACHPPACGGWGCGKWDQSQGYGGNGMGYRLKMALGNIRADSCFVCLHPVTKISCPHATCHPPRAATYACACYPHAMLARGNANVPAGVSMRTAASQGKRHGRWLNEAGEEEGGWLGRATTMAGGATRVTGRATRKVPS